LGPTTPVRCSETMAAERKMTPYEFWNKIGCPKKIVAPMVDHSDLAFRMLTRKYGADLVYTQMYNANAFTNSREIRDGNFTTCAEDRPLIFQLAGHDPEVMLQAALMVEDRCDAVDINLGCPQGIAKRGRYGAFLMDEVDLLVEIVSTMVAGLKVPVTCKVRVYDDFDRTLRLCEALVNAGASMLCVHGRTREEKGQLVKHVNWAYIARIKSHFAQRSPPVPIVANGGIENMGDVYTCIAQTGVDGVMSSEAILEDPALFYCPRGTSRTYAGTPLPALPVPPAHLLGRAEEFLHMCEKYPVWHMKCVRSHVMKMLYRYICVHTELRDIIVLSVTLPAYLEVCHHLRTLMQQAGRGHDQYSCSWYRRYRQSLEVSEGGADVVVQKQLFNQKEKMLDLQTSFLHAPDEGEDVWGLTGEEGAEGGGGIFASMFD
jgi:tRNA-dihydrouridine synthase 1